MKSRIYADTPVAGGCEDDEFKEHSLQLMECFAIGKFTLVLSDLTVQELASAPEGVRKHLSRVPEEHIEVVRLSAEARELADAYIHERIQFGEPSQWLSHDRNSNSPVLPNE